MKIKAILLEIIAALLLVRRLTTGIGMSSNFGGRKWTANTLSSYKKTLIGIVFSSLTRNVYRVPKRVSWTFLRNGAQHSMIAAHPRKHLKRIHAGGIAPRDVGIQAVAHRQRA